MMGALITLSQRERIELVTWMNLRGLTAWASPRSSIVVMAPRSGKGILWAHEAPGDPTQLNIDFAVIKKFWCPMEWEDVADECLRQARQIIERN